MLAMAAASSSRASAAAALGVAVVRLGTVHSATATAHARARRAGAVDGTVCSFVVDADPTTFKHSRNTRNLRHGCITTTYRRHAARAFVRFRPRHAAMGV